jgi:hypothetical protein
MARFRIVRPDGDPDEVTPEELEQLAEAAAKLRAW